MSIRITALAIVATLCLACSGGDATSTATATVTSATGKTAQPTGGDYSALQKDAMTFMKTFVGMVRDSDAASVERVTGGLYTAKDGSLTHDLMRDEDKAFYASEGGKKLLSAFEGKPDSVREEGSLVFMKYSTDDRAAQVKIEKIDGEDGFAIRQLAVIKK